MLDSELLNTLQSSGIIDGYEYTLRRLIEANLPTENVYEKCAYFLLEYQKLIIDKKFLKNHQCQCILILFRNAYWKKWKKNWTNKIKRN